MVPLIILQSRSLTQLTLHKLAEYGLDIVGALVILIIGWTLSNLIARWIKKALSRQERIDSTLTPLIGDAAKIVILVITIVMVLRRFGVQTASLVALIGSIGIGIGLALQGTLRDIAAGMMLITHRPISAGDAVNLNGSVGVVEKIGLFITELRTYNGVYMTLPNSTVWGNRIQNYSRNNSRRIDLTIRIHREDDIDKAINIIEDIASSDERVLEEPELLIAVRNLGESSTDLLVRPWTKPDDWWQTQLDMYKRIKERFDDEGITIPFPQRDVHLPDKKMIATNSC